MFVYSLKASTLKFFGVIAISLIALITLVAAIPTYTPTAARTVYNELSEINYSKIKTNDDRIAFISQFGWEVEAAPTEQAQVTIPDEFDKVFVRYNELQKAQGLDLEKYRRKTMERFTYKITNYPNYDGTVYVNLLVYRNKVVAGDICSADSAGFIYGFSGK